MPGPGDYNPKISAVGPNFVSGVASSPGFTFGDPTISTRDKLQRELDLRDGLVPETEQQVARGLAMQAVLARPKSPRLSPRFASDSTWPQCWSGVGVVRVLLGLAQYVVRTVRVDAEW